MNEDEIKKILEQITWNIKIPVDELFRVFSGEVNKIGGIDKAWIYRRILNGYRWYTVLNIIPKEELHFLLSDEIINTLFPRQLRNKYRHVRSALFEQNLSTTR